MQSFRSLTLLLFFTCPALSFAQMFSVTEAPRMLQPEVSSISVGYEPVDFSFVGTTKVGEPRFDFKSPVLRIRYDVSEVRFRAALGNSLGSYDGSLFSIGASYFPGIPVSNGRFLAFKAKLGVESDFIRIRPTNANRDLIWSTGSVGAGAQLDITFSEQVKLGGSVVRTVGFLSRDYGLDNGTTRSWQVPITLHIRDLFRGKGLTLGYQLTISDFDNSNTAYRYDWNSRQFFVGVNF